MTTRYFVLGTVHGTPMRRYAMLDSHNRVIQVLASVPDGREVERPAVVRWRLQPFVGGEIRQVPFHNVQSAILVQARKRAGENGRRAMAWERQQRVRL
jgi:hypothetical protein